MRLSPLSTLSPSSDRSSPSLRRHSCRRCILCILCILCIVPTGSRRFFLLLRGIVSRRIFSAVTGVCQTPLFLRSVLRGIPRKRFFVWYRLPVGVFFVLSRLNLPIPTYIRPKVAYLCLIMPKKSTQILHISKIICTFAAQNESFAVSSPRRGDMSFGRVRYRTY